MKRIHNDKIRPYLTLPNGVTITCGGSTLVMNEEILESPEVMKWLADEEEPIRIVDEPGPSDGVEA